jgi:tryptophan-rich sensory protein
LVLSGLSQKDNRKKAIRYARWLVKVVCLVLLVLPVVYLAGAPDHNVYSAISGLNEPLFSLPYGQSVCVVWTYAYSAIGPAAWLVCPVGGLQTQVTGQVTIGYLTRCDCGFVVSFACFVVG